VRFAAPLCFQGTEVMHDGFWHIDEHNRFNWDYVADEIGQQAKEATRGINALRATSPALGDGSINVRPNYFLTPFARLFSYASYLRTNTTIKERL
jgi:hypothetical protein